MNQQLCFIHSVTHFGLGNIKKSSLPRVGMTLRIPQNTQIYIIRHVHVDYNAYSTNDDWDYVSVYVEEYIPSENDSWAK